MKYLQKLFGPGTKQLAFQDRSRTEFGSMYTKYIPEIPSKSAAALPGKWKWEPANFDELPNK